MCVCVFLDSSWHFITLSEHVFHYVQILILRLKLVVVYITTDWTETGHWRVNLIFFHVQYWHTMPVVNVFRLVQLCLKTYTKNASHSQNRLLLRNMGTHAQRRKASYFLRAVKTAKLKGTKLPYWCSRNLIFELYDNFFVLSLVEFLICWKWFLTSKFFSKSS